MGEKTQQRPSSHVGLSEDANSDLSIWGCGGSSLTRRIPADSGWTAGCALVSVAVSFGFLQ